MQNILIDLSKRGGKIKYQNAVNNGPNYPSGGVRKDSTNFYYFKEAEISYARTHDSAFCSAYGNGEFLVDIHRIFRDFNADENDPASYIFAPTDKYLANMIAAGVKPFFRLGESIEHHYKFGTLPPKDNAKWARICEHVIRHYTEGWADGFHYDIEYWEIWNEPDTGYKQHNSPTWGGTMDEFFALFETALYYLKEKFPHLKIGGPALCSVTDSRDIMEDLFAYLNRDGRHAPLDFFSWHMYGEDVTEFDRKIKLVREFLDSYGYTECESILNEWNYVYGWTGDDWTYSLKKCQELKGASFVAGAMCVSQALDLDMLMYYDARPGTGMNGIFKANEPLKSYYDYIIFRDLLHLGTYVPTPYMDDKIYTCAATDGESYAMMLTYFDPDDHAEAKTLSLEFKKPEGAYKVEYYLVDDEHDHELIREEYFTSDTFKVYLNLGNYSVYDIKITKM